MGYAVLHLDKASGNDAAMSAHIERAIDPKNADKSRTHLNRELIIPPDGVTNRTEAIQHRIDTAGITRKISHNQVRAIRVMLSGSPGDMQRIEEAAGKLDEWCNDNIEWLRKTFGAGNLVSAVLHMDEKTPHIHATIVPIVTCERRKAKTAKPDDGKKKYKKRNPNAARLCVDDVMNRSKLKYYQDSYAEAMNKYGLNRGIDGSEARHITTQQYYRDLYARNEYLKESIGYLEEQKEEVSGKIWDLYDRKDEAREKFLAMDSHVRQKDRELTCIEAKLQKAKREYEPYKAQDDINLLFSVFPHLSERLRIAQLCKAVGLTIDTIKQLFKGEAVTVTGKLHSPEHNQSFNAQDAKLQLFKESKDSDRLKLSINGQNILDWFKQKYQELKQSAGYYQRPTIKPEEGKSESKGFKR
ncbi:mobilization protein BmpH [Bacteroidia bacterium]|nr:mobilization protein BmpH [Bacteroidia bacterium]